MYTDEDLYSAVKAGVLDENSVNLFRKFIESSSNTQSVDEENFRLISGFNDIFVAIASLLFLVSSGWLSSLVSKPLGFLVAALISWFLSVYFVLKRKLALPAILFLGAYVVGIFGLSVALLKEYRVNDEISIVLACAAATLMTLLHWFKFKVPITVAAGVGCLSGFIISVFVIQFPELKGYVNSVIAACGVMSFLVAMYWDAQDTERKSRKSDVAFWLHLIASPLIVHPVFSLLGVKDGSASASAVAIVVFMYLVLAIVSLAIDRRALMVSALVYVIYAFSELFKSYGAVSNGFAISGVFIGAMLIFLSAAWHSVRSNVLKLIPAGVKKYLPVPSNA